jgi:hypothetical protein
VFCRHHVVHHTGTYPIISDGQGEGMTHVN